MEYNFDEFIDRTSTGADKYDRLLEVFGHQDLVPLGIADMDFRVAQPILDAMLKRTEHHIYGYTYQTESYFDAICNWQKRRYNWDIKPEWLSFCPGIVPGLNFAVLGLTDVGDKIVIMPPAYPSFYTVIADNKRQIVESPLVLSGVDYSIDFEDLDDKLQGAKMLILCSPHNPVGRVWTRQELTRMAELCIKHDVIIISDEVHADLVFAPHEHIAIARLSPEIADRCLTFFSPSKTFNIAGLATGVAMASNKQIYDNYCKCVNRLHVEQGNVFGTVALEAAYNHGEEWLDQLLPYLSANADFAVNFIEKNIPQLKTKKPEGSFVLWVDFSALEFSQEELIKFMASEAGVAMNNGETYGKPSGTGFMRLNIGCTRLMLEQALSKIALACEKRFNEIKK